MNVKRPQRVVQSPDGSLMLVWIFGRQVIELEIDADGSTAWVFPDGMAMKNILEEVDWND